MAEDVLAIGETFITALAARDFDALTTCLGEGARGRLLIPAGLFTPSGRAAVVAEFRKWFGGAEAFEIEESRVCQLADRLSVHHRIRLAYEGKWYTCDQQVYCTVSDGLVESLDLICSGFLPDAAPGGT